MINWQIQHNFNKGQDHTFWPIFPRRHFGRKIKENVVFGKSRWSWHFKIIIEYIVSLFSCNFPSRLCSADGKCVFHVGQKRRPHTEKVSFISPSGLCLSLLFSLSNYHSTFTKEQRCNSVSLKLTRIISNRKMDGNDIQIEWKRECATEEMTDRTYMQRKYKIYVSR